MKRPMLVINRAPRHYRGWLVERDLPVDPEPFGENLIHTAGQPIPVRITLDHWSGVRETWSTLAPVRTDVRPRTGRTIFWCDECVRDGPRRKPLLFKRPASVR